MQTLLFAYSLPCLLCSPRCFSLLHLVAHHCLHLEGLHGLDAHTCSHTFAFSPLPFPLQIRWLHPVDVTGLALNRIVTIGEGEVYCYADEDKPPVGQGLNVDAEVTL